VILLARIVLSEQTAGAVGLMTQLGLGPDQLHGLFWVILGATAAGMLASIFTLNQQKLVPAIALALGLIAVGALMDAHATVLTRPAQLYASQAMLAFAAAFFIAPAMLLGLAQVLQKGTQNMVSFLVVFGVGQNVGGLLGSALVGTLETWREKFHSNQLSQAITVGDPAVAQRLQQLSGAYGRVIGDPALRAQQGQALLQQQVTQQAHVLAYNDVFLLIALVAACGCLWMAAIHLRALLAARRPAEMATPHQAAPAAVVE
jgi:hypothetical protein